MLDRSMLITALAAPLVLAAILGFAFGTRATLPAVDIGVTGGQAATVRAGLEAAQLPPNVHVTTVASAHELHQMIDRGRLGAGVVVTVPAPTHRVALAHLVTPLIAPGSGGQGTPSDGTGLDVVTTSSVYASQAATALATGIAGRYYAAALAAATRPGAPPVLRWSAVTEPPGSRRAATEPDLRVVPATIGNAGHHVLDFFAPSVAIIFLFMGAGLGMRSLLLERSGGTLVRLAAAPISPATIVGGKVAAIFTTGLVSLGCVWGVTTVAFGADWGDPLGVAAMCVGAVAAMCGLALLTTSFARNEHEAFGMSMTFGLVLALLGGNLVPPGALPPALQVLALGTPNGWTVVGFGRLALEGQPASAVVGPVVVLLVIGVVSTALATTRIARMVQP